MAKLSDNTWGYYSALNLKRHVDYSHVPLGLTVMNVSKYLEEAGQASPERLALDFYGLNHVMALIQQRYDACEKLPPAVMQLVLQYNTKATSHAIRSAYYLLMICTREARHNQSLSSDLPKIKETFGAPIANFLSSINGGESSIHNALLSKPPNTTLGKYVECLRWTFYNSKWSSSFGGPAWGAVNDCLARYVNGEYTAEMMLDTVWTLAHNNGPIFNKGLVFDHYSSMIYQILDVQRSGQIPEMILEGTVNGLVDAETDEAMQVAKKLFPDDIGSYVDWYKVEALGAMNEYPAQKNQQVTKYGKSDWAKDFEAKKAAAEKAKMLAELKAKEDFEKNHMVIMPGVHVKKVIRKQAA